MTYLKSLDTIASLHIPHLDALVTLDGEVTESDDTASPLRPINSPVALTDPNTIEVRLRVEVRAIYVLCMAISSSTGPASIIPKGTSHSTSPALLHFCLPRTLHLLWLLSIP